MKVLSAVVLLLICLCYSQQSHAQETAAYSESGEALVMSDTVILRDPHFSVRALHAWTTEMQDTVIRKDPRFVIQSLHAWTTEMQDTTIQKEPGFIVRDYEAAARKEAESHLTKRELYVKRMKDSLSAFGAALLHTADMQDTVISLDSRFVVRPLLPWPSEMQDTIIRRETTFVVGEVYTKTDELKRAGEMQDTTIAIDSSFPVMAVYAYKDRYDAIRDSIVRSMAQASKMSDSTIVLEPEFVVKNIYLERDELDNQKELLAMPAKMQDTVVGLDPSFAIRDLYPVKDSLDALRDSLTVVMKQQFKDSVANHWAGWNQYQILPTHAYPIVVAKSAGGKTKSDVSYDVADFSLYLNGELVHPAESDHEFFQANCLSFKYDDTLLLNSGLGFSVGIGVAIKIYKDKFTSSLHANTRNQLVYKQSEDDSIYLRSINTQPVTQTLKLETDPAYASSGSILLGEYTATYKRFFQKNDEGEDESRKYTVKIFFRCRVTGGINSLKTINERAGK